MVKDSSQSDNLRINERAAGGDFITDLGILFKDPKNNWIFKKSGGEYSVQKNYSGQDKEAKTIYPDCVLFADDNRLQPIVSMEFKMPDYAKKPRHYYDILYTDAKDKANRLHVDIFVLYYFQFAYIFIRQPNKQNPNKKGPWPKQPNKIMSKYDKILTSREQVRKHPELVEDTEYRMMSLLNKIIMHKNIKPAPIKFTIHSFIQATADKAIPIEAAYLNNRLSLYEKRAIKQWAKKGQAEFNNKRITVKLAINAFAKNVVMRWINRILFANLLKNTQNSILLTLQDFCKKGNIKTFKENLNNDEKITDFYSIIYVNDNEICISPSVVKYLTEFARYLYHTKLINKDINNEKFVSKLLESIIETSKRKLMGLYTTPVYLAKFLVMITINKQKGNFADFTVGSGTIAHQIYKFLQDYGDPESYIHKHLWISDKYDYPLQVANLNITTAKSIKLANLSFKKDALDLKPGMPISITNPNDGSKIKESLPAMTFIMSNLPFIESNNRSKEDSTKLRNIERVNDLNDKIDLYQGIIMHLHMLVAKKFRIGVITSNSWFRTSLNYSSFFKIMSKCYDVKDVIITNVGRFFKGKNVNVTGSIIILTPKTTGRRVTNFIGINKHLNKIKDMDDFSFNIQKLENNEKDEDTLEALKKNCTVTSYSYKNIIRYINNGLGLEALFGKLTWFDKISSRLVPLNNVFKEGRGTRTGDDKLYITDGLKTDAQDSQEIIKNLKQVKSFNINKSAYYLITLYRPISKILKMGHKTTNKFIRNNKRSNLVKKRIRTINNKSKKNKRINKGKEIWINPDQKPKVADFATEINAEKRWFWVKLGKNVTANQRLIILTIRNLYRYEKTLLHALLNSIVPIFTLIGSGFGRAQGVTDLNTHGIHGISIWNPDLLSNSDKQKIIKSWKCISGLGVENIFDQLDDPKWIRYNKLIFRSYGLNPNIYNSVRNSIRTILDRHESSRKDK